MKTPFIKTAPLEALAIFIPRRTGLGAPLALCGVLLLLLLGTTLTFAGSDTWKLTPGTGVWPTATNWAGGTVPNGAADVATFGLSNITSIGVNNIQVSSIVFDPGASPYTITVLPAAPGVDALTISGAGITNNSGITQNFVTEVNGVGQRGFIVFQNSATAGDLTAFTTKGSITVPFNGGGVSWTLKPSPLGVIDTGTFEMN